MDRLPDNQISFSGVVKGVKRICSGIKDRVVGFDPLFGSDYSGPPVCLQCHCPCKEEFCSQFCAMKYWEEFTQKVNSCPGQPQVCKYPSCTKQCYVENSGRIHDYCNRSHAREHQKMKESAERQYRASSRGRGKRNKNGKSGNSWGNGQRLGGSSGQTHPQSHQQGSTFHGGHHQQGYNTSHATGYSGQGDYSAWNSGPIYFYNRDEPYYEFTNFYNGAPVILDGTQWPTTEHYFQAQKFVGTPYVEVIRNVSRPREAFDISRKPNVSPWRRSDWEEVKMNIMRKALFDKFTRHNFLKRRLLDTGDRILVERSPHDSFWGDGGDGTGLNHLGNLLMELRGKLQCSKLPIDDVQRDSATKVFGRQMSSGSATGTSYETQASGPGSNSGVVGSGSPEPKTFGRQMSGGSATDASYEIQVTGHGSSGGVVGVGLPSLSDLTRRGLHDNSDTEPQEAPPDVPTEDLIDLSEDLPGITDSHRQLPQHMQSGVSPPLVEGGSTDDSMQTEPPADKAPSSQEQEPMDTLI